MKKKHSWIRIFEVTNAKFSLFLSYGMMHHCTKYGENWSRNFCVIASQTPIMHIFLMNKEGGENFELAFLIRSIPNPDGRFLGLASENSTYRISGKSVQ